MSETHSLFQQWFEYDLYANSKVLSIMESQVGHLPDDTLKLFSHIIAAHEIWNSRIRLETASLGVWERIPISEMAGWLNRNYENTLSVLDELQAGNTVNYETTDGRKYANNVPDILFHILTHNHYHRGQIARNMRENGIEPAETNYIVFKR
jgi:uncharacterized damage-inducible protein DinB